MERLLLVAVAGLLASLVDGSLGMGFGPTSSTILMTIGLAPTAVSFTVNLAKIATGALSGAAHWRFGNVDRHLALLLAIPGMIGAAIGVALLNLVSTAHLKPALSALLCLVAIRMFVRYAVGSSAADARSTGSAPRGPHRAQLASAGLIGGITNGLVGTWGPVVTPVTMHQPGVEPRTAIGSVSVAEIAVAVVASIGLLGSVGTGQLDVRLMLALVLGGAVAAPLAAWMVQHLPQRLLGIAVAFLLLVTNVQTLAKWAEIGSIRWVIYTAIGVFAVAVAVRPANPSDSSDSSDSSLDTAASITGAAAMLADRRSVS